MTHYESDRDFLSRFEDQLLTARRPRTFRVRRPIVLSAIGIALVTGTAVANIAPWAPDLGPGHKQEFSIAASAAPVEQREVLSVLRREQTPVDRGGQATYALRFFGTTVEGVRTDSVRVLRSGHDQGAAVLIPVASFRAVRRSAGEPKVQTKTAPNGLCLFVRDATDGGAQGCYSLDDLRSGAIRGALGNDRELTIFGLVPDPTRSIRIRFASAREAIVVPVRDNFYEHTLAASPDGLRFQSLDWLDASGKVLSSHEGLNVSTPANDDEIYQDCGGFTILIPADEDPEQACRRAGGPS